MSSAPTDLKDLIMYHIITGYIITVKLKDPAGKPWVCDRPREGTYIDVIVNWYSPETHSKGLPAVKWKQHNLESNKYFRRNIMQKVKVGILTCSNTTQILDCPVSVCIKDLNERKG